MLTYSLFAGIDIPIEIEFSLSLHTILKEEIEAITTWKRFLKAKRLSG